MCGRALVSSGLCRSVSPFITQSLIAGACSLYCGIRRVGVCTLIIYEVGMEFSSTATPLLLCLSPPALASSYSKPHLFHNLPKLQVTAHSCQYFLFPVLGGYSYPIVLAPTNLVPCRLLQTLIFPAFSTFPSISLVPSLVGQGSLLAAQLVWESIFPPSC